VTGSIFSTSGGFLLLLLHEKERGGK